MPAAGGDRFHVRAARILDGPQPAHVHLGRRSSCNRARGRWGPPVVRRGRRLEPSLRRMVGRFDVHARGRVGAPSARRTVLLSWSSSKWKRRARRSPGNPNWGHLNVPHVLDRRSGEGQYLPCRARRRRLVSKRRGPRRGGRHEPTFRRARNSGFACRAEPALDARAHSAEAHGPQATGKDHGCCGRARSCPRRHARFARSGGDHRRRLRCTGARSDHRWADRERHARTTRSPEPCRRSSRTQRTRPSRGSAR